MARKQVPVVRRRSMAQSEVAAFEKVKSLQGKSLETLRDVSSEWRNVCMIANSVVVGASFVATGQVLPKLSNCHKLVVLIGLGVAWLCSFLAVAFSLRASFGWPKELNLTSVADYIRWEKSEIKVTRRMFSASLWLAGIAMGLYFACLVVINI